MKDKTLSMIVCSLLVLVVVLWMTQAYLTLTMNADDHKNYEGSLNETINRGDLVKALDSLEIIGYECIDMSGSSINNIISPDSINDSSSQNNTIHIKGFIQCNTSGFNVSDIVYFDDNDSLRLAGAHDWELMDTVFKGVIIEIK
jgi:hypothetical protein